MTLLRLGVNVDHVATVRNARGGAGPDPVRAALLAIEAGADGITAHLREDRRHIHDDDMARLKAMIATPLNFEMAATPQMLDIALRIRPHACCLVPEKRTERTTEGGLDVVNGHDALKPFVAELTRAGIRVSMFIEPSSEALEASASLGAPVVELHTGAWCDALDRADRERADREFARLKARISKPLNFEMAATPQMLDIALKIRPHACCLVPEKRTERTTEGGLDVVAGHDYLRAFVSELSRAGIRVSLFIEPSGEALAAAASLKVPVVELHTGAWCDATTAGDASRADHEFGRLRAAAAQTAGLGLECHAGHGLDYDTARTISGLEEIVELNIGHFLVGEAIFVGLAETVRAMRAAMDEGRASGARR